MHNLIIYGGTFDPIHNGHLNTALAVFAHFKPDEFIFMPCKMPVLKNKAEATSTARLDMLELALGNKPPFSISHCEIDREGPSYTFDSLTYFRNQYGENCSISLLMGEDTFNLLPNWYKGKEILSLSNIILIERPGFIVDKEMDSLFKKHQTLDNQKIKSRPFGFIYRFNAGSFDISSSQIREKISQKSADMDLILPPKVIEYILSHNLYTRNHSKC
ncbi:MAG: nicotinate (nicotinamide) nucleotide adenylyltransferase [Proteobacteria bacterium]|nr:nicotinate (nicotinamide) nucleotide adenylyltransferase [Pseudomonadota bacterium]